MNSGQKILIELQYLPTLPYFSTLLQFEEIIIEQSENYTKGSFRNRTYIAGVNGKLRLSIPLLKGKNQQQSIKEVKISYAEAWHSAHWIAIQSAYGNSPFFEHYCDDIKSCFYKRPSFLFDFNLDLFHTLIKLLKIDLSISFSDEYHKNPHSGIIDFRNMIHPKKEIDPLKINYHSPTYAQVFQEKTGFIADLSVLDLLFCVGPQASQILEGAYSS